MAIAELATEWSWPSATARRVCHWDSGCSASRIGIATDRSQLAEIVQRVRDGLRTNIGTVSTLDDAVAAFTSTERRQEKTVIRVRS